MSICPPPLPVCMCTFSVCKLIKRLLRISPDKISLTLTRPSTLPRWLLQQLAQGKGSSSLATKEALTFIFYQTDNKSNARQESKSVPWHIEHISVTWHIVSLLYILISFIQSGVSQSGGPSSLPPFIPNYILFPIRVTHSPVEFSKQVIFERSTTFPVFCRPCPNLFEACCLHWNFSKLMRYNVKEPKWVAQGIFHRKGNNLR